jgi:hypothetical protein
MEWNVSSKAKAEVDRIVGSAVQRCSPCLMELSQSRYVVDVPPGVKDKIKDKATRHVDMIMNAALKRASVRSMEGCNCR